MRRVMARKEDAPLGVAKEEVWGWWEVVLVRLLSRDIEIRGREGCLTMPMASPRT